MRMISRSLLAILLVLGGLAHAAEIELAQHIPAVIGDNMVIQRDMETPLWGWAEPGEKVSVEASWGAKASSKATADGKWKVLLETPSYGTGHSITVQGQNRIVIKNVAIGEVWLCIGQSNMGWKLGNTYQAAAALVEAHAPDFRIFKSAVEHWHEPLDEVHDRLSEWKPCTPESAEETSAVSYIFGKKLHDELGIPVGIIQQAYAGTPIEGWMPWEIQKDDPRARACLENVRKRLQEKDEQG